jgi:hypothetical protein
LVKQWFYNNGRKRSQGDKVNYVRKWNLKQVVGMVKKAEIQVLCREQTGSDPGTKDYMAGYQKALAKVVEDLEEEEMAEYQELANEWTKRSPPVEVQRK